MPKFRVWFTREVTESAWIVTEAADKEAAVDEAIALAGDGFKNVQFELDEMSCGKELPYVSDVEDVTETEE